MKHIPDTTLDKKRSQVYDVSVRVRKVGGMSDRYYLQYKWGVFGLWHNVAEYWNYHTPWEEIWVFDNLDTTKLWQMRILKNPGLIEQIEQGSIVDPDREPTMIPEPPYNWEGIRLAAQFIITLVLAMQGQRYNDDEGLVEYPLKFLFGPYPILKFLYAMVLVVSILYIIMKILPDEKAQAK